MSDKKFPWNEEVVTNIFWDGKADCEIEVTKTLRQHLSSPNLMKFEDLLRSTAKGVAMVMDYIENMETLDSPVTDKKAREAIDPVNLLERLR